MAVFTYKALVASFFWDLRALEDKKTTRVQH